MTSDLREDQSSHLIAVELPYVIDEGSYPSSSTSSPHEGMRMVGPRFSAARMIQHLDIPLTTTKDESDDCTGISVVEDVKKCRYSFPVDFGFSHVSTPPTAMDGAWCNDLLLRVRRRVVLRRTIKRHGDDEGTREVMAVEREVDPVPLEASWEGIVSRHCTIARPLDFVYLPWQANVKSHQKQDSRGLSPQQPAAAVVVSSVTPEGDIFPPPSFVSERHVASFPLTSFHPSTSASTASQQSTNCIASSQGASALIPRRYLPSVDVETNVSLPPHRPASHEAAIKSLGERCAEVVILRDLLAKRPLWAADDLLQALMKTGRCPSQQSCINAMRCMTYTIVRGPFQRLRIAWDCDPTSDPRFAVLQRVTLRIARRTPLGVALRDASRAASIAGFTASSAVVSNNTATVSDEEPLPLPFPTQFEPITTMQAFVQSVVLQGTLFAAVQILDLMDHAAFRQAALQPIRTFDPHRLGYFTEETIRTMTQILHDEIRQFVFHVYPSHLIVLDAQGNATGAAAILDEDDGEEVSHKSPRMKTKKRQRTEEDNTTLFSDLDEDDEEVWEEPESDDDGVVQRAGAVSDDDNDV